jgi:hypothetical protein
MSRRSARSSGVVHLPRAAAASSPVEHSAEAVSDDDSRDRDRDFAMSTGGRCTGRELNDEGDNSSTERRDEGAGQEVLRSAPSPPIGARKPKSELDRDRVELPLRQTGAQWAIRRAGYLQTKAGMFTLNV